MGGGSNFFQYLLYLLFSVLVIFIDCQNKTTTKNQLDLKVTKRFVLTFPKKMKKWPTSPEMWMSLELQSWIPNHKETSPWTNLSGCPVRGQGNSLYYWQNINRKNILGSMEISLNQSPSITVLCVCMCPKDKKLVSWSNVVLTMGLMLVATPYKKQQTECSPTDKWIKKTNTHLTYSHICVNPASKKQELLPSMGLW